MGDDAVEDLPPEVSEHEIKSRYASLGLKIKETTSMSRTGYVEFCGLNFTDLHEATNPRVLKSVVKFLFSWPTPESYTERIRDFRDAMYLSPEVEYFTNLLHTAKELVEGASTPL